MRCAFLGLLVAVLPACRSPLPAEMPRRGYVEGAFSALPQAGIAAGAGTYLRVTDERLDSLEGAASWQFVSDDDFADDRNAEAGSFTQLRLGLKHAFRTQERRFFTLRWGGVWFRETGAPLIVDRAGDYVGLYLGIGFETDLSERWTMGPEVRVLAVEGEGAGGFEVLPQFVWHLVLRW